MGELIKTRARYIETEDSTKHRSILQPDRGLPNTVRVSYDGGRDNPFRPGSAIYRSADPIVDLYRNGQPSRSETPADGSSLLGSRINGDPLKPKTDSDDSQTNGTRSCWRRYFCCCIGDRCWQCCCFCCKGPQSEKVRPRGDRNGIEGNPSGKQQAKKPAKILITQHDQESEPIQPTKRVQIETSPSGGEKPEQVQDINRSRNKRCSIM